MEITIRDGTFEGKTEVTFDYHEMIDGHGNNATIHVWVPGEIDSRKELSTQAKLAVKAFLERALLAHSSEDN